MTQLLSYVSDFLNHCKIEKSLSSLTIRAYKIDLKQFSEFIRSRFKIVDAIEVFKEHLRPWLAHLLENFKPKSMKRKVATINAFYNYLEFEDVIVVNPLRKIKLRIQPSKTLPTFMTLHEIQAILGSAYQQLEVPKDKSSQQYRLFLRDIAVLETLFATGIRVSELCGIKKDKIDLARGSILILGKGNKERQLHIAHEGVRNALLKYRVAFSKEIDADQYFFVNRFGNPLQSQSVRHLVKKYVRIAQLKKRITPHTFRHSFATLLLDEGVDIKYIQHFLGHSSIVTTQIYTHVSRKKQEEILRTSHPRRKLFH